MVISFIKENMKGYQYLFDNVDTIEKYISTKITRSEFAVKCKFESYIFEKISNKKFVY